MDSPASFSEKSGNVLLLVFIACFVSFEICVCEYFFDAVRGKMMKLQTEISAKVNQKKIKRSSKKYAMSKHFKILPMKNSFWMLQANNSLVMGCSQN